MNARRIWQTIGVVVLSAVGAALVPPPEALGSSVSGTRAFTVLTSAALAGVIAVLPFVFRVGGRRPIWLTMAALSLLAGVSAFLLSGSVQRTCTARYNSRAVIIGTEYTTLGDAYVTANPGLSKDELLFDAAGVASRVWTEASVGRCRSLMSGTFALWVPLLAICLFASMQASASGVLPIATAKSSAGATAASAPEVAATLRYDVFISYRHGGRDTEFARELLTALESRGYVVAIDERDFPANASFLHEMERCIRESRFTVALISSRYLGSGNCEEEATICKVLDMGDRRRRLVPLLIESVPLPAWLFGIVGIDCTKMDPLVDPFEKLLATLGPPLAAHSPGAPA